MLRKSGTRPRKSLLPFGDLFVGDLCNEHFGRLHRHAGFKLIEIFAHRSVGPGDDLRRGHDRFMHLARNLRDHGPRQMGEQMHEIEAHTHRNRGSRAIRFYCGPRRRACQILIARHPDRAQFTKCLAELASLQIIRIRPNAPIQRICKCFLFLAPFALPRNS